MVEERIYQACAHFVPLLKYPTALLPVQTHTCLTWLRQEWPDAASHLEAFCTFVDESPQGEWEEVYTHTFDLQAVCAPYVGYQLFGESYKRGSFMAKLRSTYRACGFQATDELPDHLAVVLHFLGEAWSQEPDVAADLLELCLKPALSRMLSSLGEVRTPYREILEALAVVLSVARTEGVRGSSGQSPRMSIASSAKAMYLPNGAGLRPR